MTAPSLFTLVFHVRTGGGGWVFGGGNVEVWKGDASTEEVSGKKIKKIARVV